MESPPSAEKLTKPNMALVQASLQGLARLQAQLVPTENDYQHTIGQCALIEVAELDRQLAEGEIDAREYRDALKNMRLKQDVQSVALEQIRQAELRKREEAKLRSAEIVDTGAAPSWRDRVKQAEELA